MSAQRFLPLAAVAAFGIAVGFILGAPRKTHGPVLPTPIDWHAVPDLQIRPFDTGVRPLPEIKPGVYRPVSVTSGGRHDNRGNDPAAVIFFIQVDRETVIHMVWVGP